MAIGKPILEKSSQCQKRSITQILTLSDPKIRGQEPKTLSKRAHNPLLKEAGLTNEQVVVGHQASRGGESGKRDRSESGKRAKRKAGQVRYWQYGLAGSSPDLGDRQE